MMEPDKRKLQLAKLLLIKKLLKQGRQLPFLKKIRERLKKLPRKNLGSSKRQLLLLKLRR